VLTYVYPDYIPYEVLRVVYFKFFLQTDVYNVSETSQKSVSNSQEHENSHYLCEILLSYVLVFRL